MHITADGNKLDVYSAGAQSWGKSTDLATLRPVTPTCLLNLIIFCNIYFITVEQEPRAFGPG